MAYSMKTPVLVIFRGICFIMAVYMTILQIQRYFANDDMSTFAYKQFNKSPQDKYPTFTLCFESDIGEIFDEEYVNSTIGISLTEYKSILEGLEISNSFQPTNESIQKALGADYELAAIKLKNIMTRYTQITTDLSLESLNQLGGSLLNRNKNDYDSSMYISFQYAKKVCYTRKNYYKNAVYLTRESVTLNLAKWRKDYLYLKVYVHYPGQLTRMLLMNKNLLSYPVPYLLEKNNNQVLISLSLTNVLRRRPDANDPCDPLLDDDETKFRQTIMDLVGCIPPFWKPLHLNNSALYDCDSRDQLIEIGKGLFNIRDMMARYDPPCDEMNVVARYMLRPYKVNTGNPFTDALLTKNKLFLKFEYMDQTYQEVTNQRDFGFESFWSSAGGFIGLFLGFSLLQIVDMLFARIFKK